MKVQVNQNPVPRQLFFDFMDEFKAVLKPVKKDNDIDPVRRQFNELKAKHPDALLLFRTGDFYTMFEEDAEKGADVLGVIVTKFNEQKQASFPKHALDTYLPKLVRNGFRVAICDMEIKPKKGK